MLALVVREHLGGIVPGNGHLRHDAGEPVSRGLGNDRAIALHLTALGLKAADLRHRDEPLATFGTAHLQAAGGLPPAKRVDGDAEYFGRLPDADA